MKSKFPGWVLLGATLTLGACGDPRYVPPAAPSEPVAPVATVREPQGAVAAGGQAASSSFKLAFKIGAGGSGTASNGNFSFRETKAGGIR